MRSNDPLALHHERQARFRRLSEHGRALTHAVSIDDVLKLTAVCAAELVAADKVVIMLTHAEGLLSVRESYGVDADVAERFREPVGEDLIERLRALLVADDDRFLGVPLVVSGQLIGMLAGRVQAHANTEEQEWLMAALADQASVAIEKTRLDDAARFRERVVGIVSHDLRNPINAISIAVGTLLRLPDLDPLAARLATLARTGAERAERLVSDLLDYTQAHAGGGIPVHKHASELLVLIEQVLAELRPSHTDREITVDAQGNLEGRWDPDRIMQVLANLVTNALVHSPARTPVRIIARPELDVVTVTVHNDGPAIPAHRHADMFEPMKSVAAEGASPYRSVGLGLYIVKHLVDAHGGTLDFVTDDTSGTAFTVRLPR